MIRQSISRRALLKGIGKGVGVSVALPFLEAMLPRTVRGEAVTAPGGAAPLAGAAPMNRLLVVYTPNGVHRDYWIPTEVGANYPLSPTLQPLLPYQDDFLVLNGLMLEPATRGPDGAGDHARAMASFLTGTRAYKTQTDDIHIGISADQYMADRIGSATRFPSLELGLDYGRMEGACDPGYACIYSNNLSWRGEKTPAIKEVNPRTVFDRLFANAAANDHEGESREQQEMYNRSILDYTRQSLARLNGRLGANDRHRMDEYLTSIREIERRLDAPPANLSAVPDGMQRPVRVPETFRDHFRIMADLMVLALQTDQTRICTFALGVEQSRRTYGEIGIPEEHHGLTHHAGAPDKIEKVARIDRYIVEQFAYLVEKMKSVQEGGRSLLDNSMVVFGNGNGDGARHDHLNLPVLLAGRGGGTIDPGRHVRYPDGTPFMNLLVSLMDRMGVHADSFGDSTGRLPGLTV